MIINLKFKPSCITCISIVHDNDVFKNKYLKFILNFIIKKYLSYRKGILFPHICMR